MVRLEQSCVDGKLALINRGHKATQHVNRIGDSIGKDYRDIHGKTAPVEKEKRRTG
jgi:hypothetical protein